MTVHRITDFSLWDLRDQFSDIEAAYLWLGFEPSHSNDHPDNVLFMLGTLRHAEEKGIVTNQTPMRREVIHDKWGKEHKFNVFLGAHYSRQDLRQFAEASNQRPLFLFPEDRTLPPRPNLAIDSHSEAHDDWPKGRDQRSVKDLIAAMMTLLYGSTDWVNDVDRHAKELQGDFSLKGIADPLEIRTLTKWLYKAASTVKEK